MQTNLEIFIDYLSSYMNDSHEVYHNTNMDFIDTLHSENIINTFSKYHDEIHTLFEISAFRNRGSEIIGLTFVKQKLGYTDEQLFEFLKVYIEEKINETNVTTNNVVEKMITHYNHLSYKAILNILNRIENGDDL